MKKKKKEKTMNITLVRVRKTPGLPLLTTTVRFLVSGITCTGVFLIRVPLSFSFLLSGGRPGERFLFRRSFACTPFRAEVLA